MLAVLKACAKFDWQAWLMFVAVTSLSLLTGSLRRFSVCLRLSGLLLPSRCLCSRLSRLTRNDCSETWSQRRPFVRRWSPASSPLVPLHWSFIHRPHPQQHKHNMAEQVGVARRHAGWVQGGTRARGHTDQTRRFAATQGHVRRHSALNWRWCVCVCTVAFVCWSRSSAHYRSRLESTSTMPVS